MFYVKLQEAKGELLDLEDEQKELDQAYINAYEKDVWVHDLIADLHKKRMTSVRKRIAKWKRWIKVHEKRFDDSFQEKIEDAHRVPILDVHEFRKLYQSSKRSKALCPLHQEKTPSFTIYHTTNSWYCFGCGKGGSVVHLIKELHGFNFKEAVNFLVV